MKPINLTFEEIRDMSSKGTLDQYILSNGYQYKDVLSFVIGKAIEKVSDLESELDGLEDTLSELRY